MNHRFSLTGQLFAGNNIKVPNRMQSGNILSHKYAPSQANTSNKEPLSGTDIKSSPNRRESNAEGSGKPRVTSGG